MIMMKPCQKLLWLIILLEAALVIGSRKTI